MRTFAAAVASVVLVIASTIAGCDEELPQCHAGDYLACTCRGGGAGYAACSAAGDFASSECVCDGTTPGVDSGAPDGAREPTDAAVEAALCAPDAGDAGLRKYMESCTNSEECETCTCETFGGPARICTIRCTTPEQCPAPAETCTGRGVCRPPR